MGRVKDLLLEQEQNKDFDFEYIHGREVDELEYQDNRNHLLDGADRPSEEVRAVEHTRQYQGGSER